MMWRDLLIPVLLLVGPILFVLIGAGLVFGVLVALDALARGGW